MATAKRKRKTSGRKRPRSPAQRAATKRMLAANEEKREKHTDTIVFVNPRGGKKRRKRRGKRRNPLSHATDMKRLHHRVAKLERFEGRQMGFNRAVSNRLETLSSAVRQIYSGSVRQLGR